VNISFAGEWTYFTGAFVTIFFIVDPFAVVPVYLSMAERFDKPGLRAVRLKATVYALAILSVFAVTGMTVFELFGITLPAFQIAGGILLLMMGVSQLNAQRKKVSAEEEDESLHRDDISVFPLAMPLLAGPGAISTVILLTTEAGSVLRRVELMVAIVLCMVASFLVLSASAGLKRVLGRTGLNILSRIMGIVLTAVAVQFILNGVGDAVARWAASVKS
jgi:multiple antibiotic resistance protein